MPAADSHNRPIATVWVAILINVLGTDMKIKLFAAAAAAMVSAGAYAQSSVTMYGVVDAGIEYVTNASGNAQNFNKGQSVFRMTSGNMSGSRWGLRGVEDLGAGLKGVFTLESGFDTDTGAQSDSGRLFNRQAFVGLQGNFGAVTLGRQTTPVYDFSLIYDPMALARYSLASQDKGMSSRADNALKYVGTFGGFTASALYSFGYDKNGEIPGNSRQGREMSVGLNYAAGPFSVGAFYDQRQALASASTALDTIPPVLVTNLDDKTQRAGIAGTYAYGPVKAFAGYRWSKNSSSGVVSSVMGTTSTAMDQTSSLYWLGLGYQATPALALTGAAYYQHFQHSDSNPLKGGGNPWLLVASVDYSLSKRTDVYWNLAYTINSSSSGDGIRSTLGVAGFGESPTGRNQFGTVVGMRHKF